MDTELTFTGSLSLKETLEMDRYRLKFFFRPIYRWSLYCGAMFFLIMSIYRIVQFGFSFFPVIVIIGSIYAIIGWKIERSYRIHRAFKKSENEDRQASVRITEENIYIKNRLMESSFDWQVVKCAINGPGGFLVQVANHQNLFYLPSYLFDGN
jgi:hypothetical protein